MSRQLDISGLGKLEISRLSLSVQHLVSRVSTT